MKLIIQRIMKIPKTLLLVGVIIIALVIYFNSNSNSITSVREFEITPKEVIKNINASGETRTNRDFVYKSPVSAKIKKINVKSGEEVNKEQVVLEFDELSIKSSLYSTWQAYLAAKATSDSLEEQINAAKASVSDKRFARDSAQREYNEDDSFDNKQALKTAESNYQSSISSLSTLEDKKESIAQNVNSALAAYLVSKDNSNNIKIKALDSGLIALNSLNPGDSILVGQELFSITNSSILEFIAEVDEADVQQVKLGQPAVVELEGYPDRDFSGTVSLIDAKTKLTTSGSNIVETYIKISFEGVRPIIGLTGTAKIEIGKETEKLAVPFDSIIFENADENYVFVIKDNRLIKTKIEVGFEGDEYYAIKSGLNPGDKVVTGNDVSTLKDGQKVSVIKN